MDAQADDLLSQIMRFPLKEAADQHGYESAAKPTPSCKGDVARARSLLTEVALPPMTGDQQGPSPEGSEPPR